MVNKNTRRHRSRKTKIHFLPYVLSALFSLMLVILILVAASRDSSNQTEEPPTAASSTAASSTTPNRTELVLELNGEEDVVLEYGEAFLDAGVNAYHITNGTKYPLEPEVISNVDLSALGEYKIVYRVSHGGEELEKTRTVQVVDTQCPEILLNSSPEGNPSIGETYQEEGFTATDNYDGDLTDQVERIVSDDGKTITYRVSDSSGNVAEVIRNVVYVDRGMPDLRLNGSTTITITAGSPWTEPGYTAWDAVDGDLTNRVRISGRVDVNVSGTYTVNYLVTDAAGNEVKAQRVVIVEPKPAPVPQPPSGEGKVIYLTFDDGPSSHTPRLLEVLARYDVKATFFVVNTGKIGLLSQIAQAGHTIGIHSYSHDYKDIYSSTDRFFADFYKIQNIIFENTGVMPEITRFPGGSSNMVSTNYDSGIRIMSILVRAVTDLGYRYYDWNIDSNDAGGAKSAEEVFRNVTGAIASSSRSYFVVLQHDTHGFSVDAVERIIQWGLDNGYTFAALDANSPPCEHSVKN